MIVTANMLTPRIRTGITSRVKASLAGFCMSESLSYVRFNSSIAKVLVFHETAIIIKQYW